MSDETFVQIVERAMAEVAGKGMLTTDVLKHIMLAMAQMLDKLHAHVSTEDQTIVEYMSEGD